MRINAADKIAGLPILDVRKFLKANNGLEYWSETEIGRILKLDTAKSIEVLDALVDEGLIEKSPRGPGYYTNTIAGNALAIASAAKPASRKSAEKVFAEFMARVRTVNADPYYLYKVRKVILFGSFLGDAETVNDIDIALDVVPKETDHKIFGGQLEARRAEAIAKGRHFKNFLAEVTWPQDEVWLFLKSRSRLLSFHFAEDPILMQVEYKVVFEEV